MHKILKFSLVTIGVILMLLLALITYIPRPPFKETVHYKLWKTEFTKWNPTESFGSISVGWAAENITPDFPAPLAGYGKRKGIHFANVHDSIYVRSIAVKDSQQTIFFVSADLLFIPPKVVESVKQKLGEIKHIHFSATHSHSSVGGWENTLTGELFGGDYDPKIVELLAGKFVRSIQKAEQNLSSGKIYYSEVVDEDDVRYRLNGIKDGIRDTEVRSLSFEKANGQKAHLLTYSAHNTTLSDGNHSLSRDYSGALVDSLKPDFGVFMSGAVASMGPVERGPTEFNELSNEANSIFYYFQKRQNQLLSNSLVSDFLEIPLPQPTARLTKHLALRPWVFKKFFGDYKASIKVTKIGKCLILGMPADFSGEIMVELDKYAKQKGLDLIITSFNGGYIGYVTADKLYDSGQYETQIMSWYGYQNGGYFTEISKNIIDKMAELK